MLPSCLKKYASLCIATSLCSSIVLQLQPLLQPVLQQEEGVFCILASQQGCVDELGTASDLKH